MNIISEITRGVFFMQPDIARQYFPIVHNILSGNINAVTEKEKNSFIAYKAGLETISKDKFAFSDSLKQDSQANISDYPSTVKKNSLFCLNVVGAITKYDQFCGPEGTKSLAGYLKLADDNPNIIGHILCIDSGGGEGYAAHEFAAAIQSLSKPTFAFIEGMAASAAYLIASACSLICARSPIDRIGSIGTFVTLADYTKWYENEGIKLTEVYATKSKDKNRDYLDAIAGNTEKIQALVDTFNETFIHSVLTNRSDNLIDDGDTWGTGKMFFANEAKQIGLIDIIAPFDDFVSSIIDHISNNN